MGDTGLKRKTRAHWHIPKKFKLILLLCIGALLLCLFASLRYGSRIVTLEELVSGLTGNSSGTLGELVIQKRITRTVFCLLAGAALGIAGALMQAVTRNPIADPSILGVNTGASLFVVCGIAFFQISTLHQYIWFAMAGAGITAIFVYSIGSMGKSGATPIKLALAGAATSAALSSIVSAVLIPRTDVMDEFRFWQVGSVGSATWEGIFSILPFLAIGIAAAVIAAPALNAMALGEEMAASLGVRTGILRLTAALASVILCGAATALAGPIGFIGLLAPHVMRLLLGPDQRLLIPMSALTGAIVLTLSDVLGRVIGRPGELEVGIVTAFIGAPLLIFIAMKSKVRTL